jgi:hypothetical protein
MNCGEGLCAGLVFGIGVALHNRVVFSKTLRSEQMGIIQFLVLTLFVLTYVTIIGGLLARVIVRVNEIKKQSDPKPEEVLIGG